VPQTKGERIIAAVGLVAIAVLVALVVSGWRDYRDEAAAREKPAGAAPTVVTAGQPTSTGPESAQVVRPNRAATRPWTLVVRAVRGECWLEVRAPSATGTQLYQGLLASKKSVTFRRQPLWIRLGAGENVDVTLRGKPVPTIPAGTADLIVSAAGVRPAP
jgi:hypothetical protein